MGRPCTCSCGSGVIIVPPVVPPSGDPPNPALPSGSGPWKVYVGGGQYSSLGRFIHAFETEPTISAFAGTCIVCREGIQSYYEDGHSPAGSAYLGGVLGSSIYGPWDSVVSSYGGSTTYSISGIMATLSGNPFISYPMEVGKDQIWGVGFRINSNGYFSDDEWDWSDLDEEGGGSTSEIIAVDGRAFIKESIPSGESSFGTRETYYNWYSMGANYVGQIGRDGVASGSIGTPVIDYTPEKVDDPVDGADRPWDGGYAMTRSTTALSASYKGADVGTYTDPTSEPNSYVFTFGLSGPAGHRHGMYDPQISSPPIGISPPQAVALPSCAADSWYNTLLYGSSFPSTYLFNSLTGYGCGQNGSEIITAGGKWGGIGGSQGAFRWTLGHVVDEVAFPPMAAGSELTTNALLGSRFWGDFNVDSCPIGNLGGSQRYQYNKPHPPAAWNGGTVSFYENLVDISTGYPVYDPDPYYHESGIPYRRILQKPISPCSGLREIEDSTKVPYWHEYLGYWEYNTEDTTFSALSTMHLTWSHEETQFMRTKFTINHEGESTGGYWIEDLPVASGRWAGGKVADGHDYGSVSVLRGMLRSSGTTFAYHMDSQDNSRDEAEAWASSSHHVSHMLHGSGVAHVYIAPYDGTLIYVQYNDEEPNYTNTSGVPASGARYFS